MSNIRRTTLFSVVLSLVLFLSLAGYVGQAQAASILPGDCAPTPNWAGYYVIAAVQSLQKDEQIKVEFTYLPSGYKWTEVAYGPYNAFNFSQPAGTYRVVMKEGASGTVRADYTITCAPSGKISLDSLLLPAASAPLSILGTNITVNKNLSSSITKSGDGYKISTTNASGVTDTLMYYPTADSNLSVDNNTATITFKGSKLMVTRDTYISMSRRTDAGDLSTQARAPQAEGNLSHCGVSACGQLINTIRQTSSLVKADTDPSALCSIAQFEHKRLAAARTTTDTISRDRTSGRQSPEWLIYTETPR